MLFSSLRRPARRAIRAGYGTATDPPRTGGTATGLRRSLELAAQAGEPLTMSETASGAHRILRSVEEARAAIADGAMSAAHTFRDVTGPQCLVSRLAPQSSLLG